MDSMKAPCSISRNLKLSNSNYNSSENDDVKGGVFKDCKYAWTACKTELRLFRMSVGNKIATWRFGADISQSDSVAEIGQEHIVKRVPHITCVCELPARGAVTSSTAPQLLVGLDCGPGRGGAVCICDSSSGSVIATINVSHPVSSMSVIDGGASPASRLLSPAITNMCGVAAVGLKGCGYVLLVDLRRHDPDGPHTTILLNEDSFQVPRKFALKGSDGKVRCFLPSLKVDVTCIHYVPCMTSLLVGYNFGCFEIWDLREQKIRYVSPVMEQTIPVAHIAFQEPSDDPRNFCYVWAVHSPSGAVSDNSSDSCHPVAFMYALCYEWKEWQDGCGYIYEGFKGCSQHYVFEMKAYENKESLGGSSLTCQAVGTAVSRQHRSLGPDDFDDSTNEGELSLCLFAWQSLDTDCKNMLRVALFDIDRWYKEEMPQAGTGSYIVVFYLEDTLHSWTNPVLDVVVDESSLQPYRSDTGHEEYYRPSALSFASQVLFEDELVEINHPGEQQFLLSHLDKSGPLALLHPAQLYKHCLSIGLRPALFDFTSPSSEISLDQQRRFLLALALEWQMSGFLHSCAVEWASGSQSVAGCSLPVLLTWGWEFALVVKDEASKLCAPLFDHSGTKLDRAGRRMLSMYRNQLGHLAKLFRGVLTSPKIAKIYVPDSVEKQAKALEMISLYFEVVQWFMNAGLLPEFPDDGLSYGGDMLMEDHHKLLPYPSFVIKKFYKDRRAELKGEVPLFVDLLLEQDKSHKLKELWIQDGGSGCYPPPSLQALLQTYLVDVLDTTAKHRFVIYVFLDLAETLDDRYAGAINYLIKFPAAFYMRPSIIKITQAMWLLDHKDFEEALRMLLDPMIRPIDLEQWQHRAIALAFLKQGKANLALDYIVCRNVPLDTFEDIKLKISILIENKKVLEAYDCQSMYSVGESNQELMEFFLCELHRTGLLDQVFYLTLTPLEEKCFFQFLEKYSIRGAGGTKIIYYLQHSRIIEAFETVDKLERKYNKNYFNENLRSLPYKYVAKSVEGLPEITRKTADVYRSTNAPCNPGTIPEPLSMTLYRQKSSGPIWDRSTGIETILRKIKETWVPELVNDADSLVQKTPFLFSPFNFQPNRQYNSTRAVCITEKKRAREDEEKVGTPAKRCRTEDMRPVNNTSIIEKSRQSQEVDVSLLLDTPRIKRLSELRGVGSASFSGTPVREMSAHHSILKVHSVSKKSLSPEDSVSEEINRTTGQTASSDHRTDLNTDSKKTEEKEDSEASVLSASRQIRFALPRESKLDRKKSIMGVSPRKALYEGHVAHTRNTQVEERRPEETSRPICFFPKPSSAIRDAKAPESKTVCSEKKFERTLSFSPSPRKQDSFNIEDRPDSRVADIKGKYFFPPKPKVDEDSEENQEDSFVSATSDVDSNTESTSGDIILSPLVSKSTSKDLKQNVSATNKIAECHKVVDSMQSVDDHMFKEKWIKTDAHLLSAHRDETSKNISPRITKRESIRRSNVSFLTNLSTCSVGDSKMLKSPSNDPVKFEDPTQTSDSNSPQIVGGIPNIEKSSSSFMCVSLETEATTSSETGNKNRVLSFSRSSITRNISSSLVRSRRTDQAQSAVDAQKYEDDPAVTHRATSHLETSSLPNITAKGAVNTNNKTSKGGSESFVSFLPEPTVHISPGKSSSRQADERGDSPGDTKQSERTVFLPVEDELVSDKSSFMGIRTVEEGSINITYPNTRNNSAKSFVPDSTLHSIPGEIVRNEQLGEDVSPPGIIKEKKRCASLNVEVPPVLDRSLKTLVDIKTRAADKGSSVQKKCSSKPVSSFFPGGSSSSIQSAGGIKTSDNTDDIVKSTEATSEIEQMSMPLVEIGAKAECISRPTLERASTDSGLSFLTNSTTYDSPISTVGSMQAEDLQNPVINIRTKPKTDELLTSSIGIRTETGGLTPEKTCSSPIASFLPDTTIWNTTNKTTCTRPSDDKLESPENKKMSERSDAVTNEGTPKTDKSLDSLIGTEGDTRGNVSLTCKETCISPIVSVLPDTTIWNTPNKSTCTRPSDELESPENTKMSGTIDVLTDEVTPETEKSLSSLMGIEGETRGNFSSTPMKTCVSPVASFLPDTTIWSTPNKSTCTRPSDDKWESPENTNMSERSNVLTDEGTPVTDKSCASLIGIEGETKRNVSSTHKETCISPIASFLPDTTIWNTPNKSTCTRPSDDKLESPENTRMSEKSVMATDEGTPETNKSSASLKAIESETELNVNLTPTKTCISPIPCFLPETTIWNTSNTDIEPKSVETETLENQEIVEQSLHNELQRTVKSADSRNVPEVSRPGPEDKKEKHHAAVDSDDDDDDDDDEDDEDWHASVNEEEEDSEEEQVPIDDVGVAGAESASSSSASIIIISSSSSLNSSDSSSSDSEMGADDRKQVCDSRTSSVDFDPLVDPESDTDEEVEVAAAAVPLKSSDSESQNVGLRPLTEECRDGAEIHQTLSAENQSVADADQEQRDNITKDVVTKKAKETENVDIQSIHTGDGKVSESVGSVEASEVTGTAYSIDTNNKRIRKGLSERQLSRCSSEPPANVAIPGRRRAKKSRSTDTLNKLTGSSAITETFMDKVSQSKDEARGSPTTNVAGEENRNNTVDDSPRVEKRQSISDIRELPHVLVSDDVHNSIQEWMNSPVVTRAGFRRLSSIQSEPPQMDDVSDIVSLPRTRRKKTSSVIMESTSPKKRGRKHISQDSLRIETAKSEVQNAEREQQMEEYTTERRLTRYQRSLLARSADLAAGRGQRTQSHEMKTLSLPSQSPVRLRSSDRRTTPSPGDTDNISIAHSEESDLSSSLTSSSFLQRSPRSARSEDVVKRPSRRNHNTAGHSPSSVRSMPVAPAAVSRYRRLRQVKKKGGEVSEELQKDVSALHPARRTRSHPSLDTSKSKPSPDTSHEDLAKRESQAKAEFRVTRSVARHAPNTSHAVLQPIPEESTASSADASNKQSTPTEQRKRKHPSRSPVVKKTSPRNKNQGSTRISPRKAMRLRSRLLK